VLVVVSVVVVVVAAAVVVLVLVVVVVVSRLISKSRGRNMMVRDKQIPSGATCSRGYLTIVQVTAD